MMMNNFNLNNKDNEVSGLIVLLSKLKLQENKKSNLEQYFTPPELALKFLKKSNLKNKVIIDLGSGNGILGLTALLLGARKAIFVEIDNAALNIAKKNYEFLKNSLQKEFGSAEFINKDISLLFKSELPKIDIAILNPPFGTIDKNKRIDAVFLKKAMKLANEILTMHKTASKDFIKSLLKDNKFTILYEKDILFPINKIYQHHKQDNVNIGVTLLIAEKL